MKSHIAGRLALAILFTLALTPLAAQAGAGPAAPAPSPKGQGRGELLELRKEYKNLNLTDEEIKGVRLILDQKANELDKAQAEIKIIQARLERLMLEANPSRDDIQKLVKSSLDWEFSIRMIRIEQSLALRKLLGDERWAVLQRLVRAFQQARRLGLVDQGGGGEMPAALAALLGRL